MCSKIREKPLVKGIGLKFDVLCLLPLLLARVTKAVFHCSGNSVNFIELLKITKSKNLLLELHTK